VAQARASPHTQPALSGSLGATVTVDGRDSSSQLAPHGRFRFVPGAHSFVWTAPSAWSEPIERLARNLP
jgi:hypothetical protein